MNSRLAVSPEHSLALLDDGTVWAWGRNDQGQLGDGTKLNSKVPVQVRGLPEVVGLAAGRATSVALAQDGSVWTWGSGSQWAAADGGADPTQASRVPALEGMAGIVAGNLYVLALAADGAVWGWGNNTAGQLGNGTTQGSSVPTRVPGLDQVTWLSVHDDAVLAVRGDGTVWGWGREMGTTPVQVPGLTGVVAVSKGTYHSLALKADGTVWGWGSQFAGEINADAGPLPSTTLFQVPGLTDAAAVAAGEMRSFVLTKDGTLWGWGSNVSGAVGIGSLDPANSPTRVLGGVESVAVGMRALARKTNGELWAWGNNLYGELGNGNDLYWKTPAAVPGVTGARVAGPALWHGLAILADGGVVGWGDARTGELGPQPSGLVMAPAPVGATGSPIVATGSNFLTLLLSPDGSLWSMGRGDLLGLGWTDPATSSAVQVPTLDQVKTIATGPGSVIAVRVDGTVWSWGGEQTLVTGGAGKSPAQVPGLTDVTSVATSGSHTLALVADGGVWAWGSNEGGQLGDGTMDGPRMPFHVEGVGPVVALAVNGVDSFALAGNGSVYSWGGTSVPPPPSWAARRRAPSRWRRAARVSSRSIETGASGTRPLAPTSRGGSPARLTCSP